MEKAFTVVEHELPGRTQLEEIARGVATEPGELPAGAELDRLLDAAAGLTRIKAENAFGPCVVVIDEVDHALAGHNSNGDSGVMSRFFGQMQSWLNDHTSDAFVVCTSNDVSTLPAAFTRAERFDGLFYVGLPGVAQKRAIWRIYSEKYGLDPRQAKPVDADWSGAEIKACCRLAALLEVPLVEAAQNVVLVARTAQESLEGLRRWASGRCLSADVPGVFLADSAVAAVTTKPGRKIRREASNN